MKTRVTCSYLGVLAILSFATSVTSGVALPATARDSWLLAGDRTATNAEMVAKVRQEFLHAWGGYKQYAHGRRSSADFSRGWKRLQTDPEWPVIQLKERLSWYG